METDPDRWIAALRASHDRLVTLVDGLDDEGLGAPSMCTEWTVAQVLSHLGSGAEIARPSLLAAVGEADPLPEGGAEEIWARWNTKSQREMATSFVAADRTLVEAYEGLDADQRRDARIDLPFLPDPIDVAAAVGFRLGEHALHAWDVAAAFDSAAEVTPDATELLVDRQPVMVALMGRFMPRETRPTEDVTIAVTTTAPDRRFELELGERCELRPVGSPSGTSGELVIPAEALLRLMAGRLKPGTPAADVEPTGGVTMDELHTAFPGY